MLIEEVINISIPIGATGKVEQNVATEKDGSEIIGCAIFHSGLDANPNIINAHIQCGGIDVSKMQHIENYRSREAGYRDSFKPVKPFQSGKQIRFEVRSESAFTSAFTAQLILIKEIKDC